jgi:hypothetical protein
LTQVQSVSSNITFGGANDSAYIGQPALQVNASENYSYSLSNFGFGIVYQTNGVDSSDYFETLARGYPVIFSTNFKGLGLPESIFSEVVTLLEDITSTDISCDDF